MLKISVIIPCYNASETVEETLYSLEKQTYKNFEVICVNDGSKDDTLSILSNYQQKTNMDMKILSQENAGVSVARNLGISNANGSVLLFLDADDMYASTYFAHVAYWHEKGYDVVFGEKTEVFDELDKSNSEAYKERTKAEFLSQFTFEKGKYHFSLFSYKKEYIDKYNIRFTPGARYGEDWEFATKVLDCCTHGVELLYPVMFRRIISTSVMHQIVYNHVDAIASAERTESWLKNADSDFYPVFAKYMRHRAVFSVAHKFSKHQAKELFAKF